MDAHIRSKFNDTDLLFNDSDVTEATLIFCNETPFIVKDNLDFQNSSLSANNFYDPASSFVEYLNVYSNGYRAVHGYLSFTICVFGIIANILNITVLTRKNMVSSINAILTGLAVADMLFMLLYLPHAYHHYIRNISVKERFSYEWEIFNLISVHFSFVSHAISTWLTVTVAIWRYIAVSFPLKSVIWCSMARAKYAITATYITCVVFFIQNYITLGVSELESTKGEIIYVFTTKIIFRQHTRFLQDTIFLLFSVFIKLLPCVALTVLSFGTIRALNKGRKRRKILKNGEESARPHSGTTKMLLTVVLLFLLTQLPEGVLYLLSALLEAEFTANVTVKFRETVQALSLINSSVNFVIYCTMSRKFRDTFSLLFIPKCIHQQEIVPVVKLPKTCYEMRRR